MAIRLTTFILPICILFSTAYAADTASHATVVAESATEFTVKAVKIKGLRRIPEATIVNYLTVKAGDKFDADMSNRVISSLYASGFFSDIVLSRLGDTLIVQVTERPVIGELTIHGNRMIKTKALKQSLDQLDIKQGLEYNPSVVTEIKTALLRQYAARGHYNVRVDVKVSPLPRDRVSLTINIAEGKKAKIKRITVTGNHIFSEKTLLHQFKMSPPTVFSFITGNDVYSHDKLAADLNRLRDFYLNHGYARYRLNSAQVSMSPDREQVYINANISEGVRYTLGGYRFAGNTHILSQSQLDKLAALKKGQVFSRKRLLDARQAILAALRNKGYARAAVVPDYAIDDAKRQVSVVFRIEPGERIYVRHIVFADNYSNDDKVLRRKIEQPEGALASTKKIQDSKRNLLQLPYIKAVDISTRPVPGKSNEEDVVYKVKEYPNASFNASIGYSDAFGLLFSLGLNQKSFLGSGNQLGLNFMRASYLTQYSINYYNPSYTQSGIGRGIDLSYSQYNGTNFNVTSYNSRAVVATMYYNIPVSRHTSYRLGYGFENILLTLGSSPSTQTQNYVNQFGRSFSQVPLNLSWNYRNIDRFIMTTKGWVQSIGLTVAAPVSGKSLKYYKLKYHTGAYYPLYKRSWLLHVRGDAGYAEGYGRYAGNYPFFENFYAGGIDSVRGYITNALGPKDSNGQPLGGNVLMDASVGLVFPNPAAKYNIRTTWFFDGGNVFNTNKNFGPTGVKLGQLRYSTGVEVDWLSPLGVTLRFALAQPISPGSNKGDTQFFSFSIGAGV